MSRVRVLIIDGHEIVRRGLRALLEDRPNLLVVGEAATAAEAVGAAAKLRPDVIVMDICLPDGNGVDACREIKDLYPHIKVIMLTSHVDDEAIFSSIMAGASGYILKQTRGDVLVEAIETVAAGGSLLDPTVTERVLYRLRSTPSFCKEDRLLSKQEQRILSLIAEGYSNREIAQALFLSEGTVKNYVSHILHKLNLCRRSQLIAYLARRQHGPFQHHEPVYAPDRSVQGE